MTGTIRVIGTKGCGSVIAEAALILCGVDYTREEVDYEHPPASFLALNPLGQVPTIVMPDGSIMTETAAFALWLDGEYPRARLLPPVGDPQRAHALRWLVYFVAAIYPTFTYGDSPAKWVGDAGDRLRASTNAHRERCWQQVEAAAIAGMEGSRSAAVGAGARTDSRASTDTGTGAAPWFLGKRMSMLDVYICVMSQWRPRRAWFATHAPKLHAIATAVDADPRLRPLWDANFEAG